MPVRASWGVLMYLLTFRSLFCQQFLNRLHDPQPNGPAIHIAGLHRFVRSHGGIERCVLAVLLDEFGAER